MIWERVAYHQFSLTAEFGVNDTHFDAKKTKKTKNKKGGGGGKGRGEGEGGRMGEGGGRYASWIDCCLGALGISVTFP